jgi:hypothetical protein
MQKRTNRQKRIGLSFGMLAVVFCGAASLGSIGCGGDSGPAATPADKFIGRWETDETTTTSKFTLTCQTNGTLNNFITWFSLDFERGTLTDLSDVSTSCTQPGLSFDVDTSKTSLSLVSPDPYLVAPNNQPTCVSSLGSDGNGGTFYLVFTPTTATFTLLAHTAGSVPMGLFAANGSATVVDVSSTGAASMADTCTYTGTGDQFHQMTRL